MIAWDSPIYNGGLKITGYIIEMRKPDEPEFSIAGRVGGEVTKFQVFGLRPQKDYLFRVSGENRAGPSDQYATLQEPVRTKRKLGELEQQTKCKLGDFERIPVCESQSLTG